MSEHDISRIVLPGGLGREYDPDPRDRRHPMRSVLPTTQDIPAERIWNLRDILDQGQTPRCVGYMGETNLRAGPIMARRGRMIPSADELYSHCLRVDEWEGEADEGTSVRALMRVFQARGLIREYVWAQGMSDFHAHLLLRGPVMVGTSWFWDMYWPDDAGYLTVGGRWEGGHAYLVVGYDKERDAYRIANSWGRAWGDSGRAWMRREEMEYLLWQADGEAVSAIEIG